MPVEDSTNQRLCLSGTFHIVCTAKTCPFLLRLFIGILSALLTSIGACSQKKDTYIAFCWKKAFIAKFASVLLKCNKLAMPPSDSSLRLIELEEKFHFVKDTRRRWLHVQTCKQQKFENPTVKTTFFWLWILSRTVGMYQTEIASKERISN